MPNTDTLYVVTCIFNPENYKSRYKLFYDFEAYLNKFNNVELYTVELAFEDQNFVVTCDGHPNHIQLRTNNSLWYKETLLNIGIKNLPVGAKYIAWIDADIHFIEDDWAEKTIEALKNTPIVQMFKTANDLGPDSEIMNKNKSFIYKWLNNESSIKDRGRSGLAWAATREALDNLGLLIDWGIIGSGDWFMAFALTDLLSDNDLKQKTGGYSTDALDIWYDKCKQHINKNVGYVDITLEHNFHGSKKDRGYNWRWKILSENKFNPLTDLDYDEQGLIQLKANKPQLLEDIKNYFKSRNEDSTEK